MDEKPSRRRAREARQLALPRLPRGRTRATADAVVGAGNTGAMLAAGLLEIRRLPDVHRPAIAVPLPALGGAVDPDRRRRERRRPARAPPPVRAHGRGLRRGDRRPPRPDGGAPLDRRGAGEGQQARPRGPRRARRPTPGINFIGNVEGRDLLRKAGRRRRLRRLHREHGAEAARGHDPDDARRPSGTRSPAPPRGKLGGLLIRPAARGLRTRLDPDTYGGAYLLGLRGLVVIAHGNSSATAIANAIRYGARGVAGGVVERVAERLAGAGRARRPPRETTAQAW